LIYNQVCCGYLHEKLYGYYVLRVDETPALVNIALSGAKVTYGYTAPEGRIESSWMLVHARRRFDEAVRALPKARQKDSHAYLALTMI
jgi:hypothetical protein